VRRSFIQPLRGFLFIVVLPLMGKNERLLLPHKVNLVHTVVHAIDTILSKSIPHNSESMSREGPMYATIYM
jgi:hypothetical protein